MMTDSNRIHPHYRDMLGIRPRQTVTDPSSHYSQAVELGMDPGAKWSLAAAKGVYEGGGNDPEVGPDPEEGLQTGQTG